MDLIQKLKGAPIHTKTNVAVGVAFALTGIIAVVWTTTLPARFSELSVAISSVAEETENVAEIGNSLDTILNPAHEEPSPAEPEVPAPYTPPAQAFSALNELDGWSIQATSSNTMERDTVPELQEDSVVDPHTTVPETVPVPAVENIPPKQAVILIATTTKNAQ